MNDELDTLRSFRPEAARPTGALQLRERNALMETIARTPTTSPRRTRHLRPRRRIALGIAVLVLAAAGTAGATGIIPEDVQQALGLVSAHTPDAALAPEIDQAVEQTSAPAAGGGTIELWTAPTTGGGTCAYLRHLDASGTPTDSGPISCVVSIAGGGRTGESMGVSASPGRETQPGVTVVAGRGALGDGGSAQFESDSTGATVFGQAPSGAAAVEVVDASGSVVAEAAPINGWYLLSLPPDEASAAASIVALSASGASLATTGIAPAAPAAGTGDANGTPFGPNGATETIPAENHAG
jgi:hypothetical protein